MSDTQMNPVCPMCGEEITKRQGTIQAEVDGRNQTVHRNHFDTSDSAEAHGTIAEVAEVDRVPAPQDSAPLVVDTNEPAPAAPVNTDNQ